MIFPLGIAVAITLVFFLKARALLWLGLICLVWVVLAFVPDFFDVAELDKSLNGALMYFSMYGAFIGFPCGIILLIAGTLKRLKEKNPKSNYSGACHL